MLRHFGTLVLLAGPALSVPTLRYQHNTERSWPQSIAAQVHDQTWPDFANVTARWSTYSAPTFTEVFLPESAEDLSTALAYLSTTNRQWLAQSGGHGYSPTLGSIQDAVQINMRNFRYVNVNEDGTATVGTGTRFNEMVWAVGDAGREITVGNCPCVGALGATLGGGLGRLSGLHGLTSDSLLSANLVLWNGTQVKASADTNPDLFWGIRGAGQNFGIIYEATYQTYEQTNNGMQYTSDYMFDRANLSSIINITNDLLAVPGGLDARLAIMLTISYDVEAERVRAIFMLLGVDLELTLPQPLIILNLVYAGPEEEAQKYSGLYRPYSSVFAEQVVPWTNLSSVALFGTADGGCDTNGPVNQYAVMTRNLDQDVFIDMVDSFSEFAQNNPQASSTSAILVETFGQQGIEAHSDDFSAFPHRGAFHNAIALSMGYADEIANVPGDEWAREWRARLAKPKVSGYKDFHVYQNYANDDEPLSAMYGAGWRQKRLTALKNAYDPQGRFNGYHAIPSVLKNWS
ncbi:hypothetical protein S40293_07102 [Stachybotrys chartarum IBT 40293]|nr:hypothetical protein S40293_07102 [Stachybotrys chartarum IBT 40293]